jgi:hypothetical protein
VYVIGKFTPVLIKKIINDKNNVLDATQSQDDPPTSNGL